MISGVYGMTMQWTPEQTQWAEQHFDITSTTRSPAHKADAFRGQRLPSSATAMAAYQYSWANDDISALTASNLLKRYAERYSAILDVPCDRGLIGYPDPAVGGAPGLMNGRKAELDPWQDGVYPSLGCVSEVLPKGVPDVAASVCSSPGVGAASLTEPTFSSSSCGSQSGAPEYAGATYSGSYLHPGGGYSGHPASALHSPLLQPGPSHTGLVPSYSGTTSPGLVAYGYAPSAYPTQGSLSTGYSPPPPPPAPYLPAGIATPTPSLGGYSYPPHSLTPMTATSLNGSSTPGAGGLKRKPFYVAEQGEIPPYEEFGFGSHGSSEPPSTNSPLYRPAGGDVIDGGGPGRGFDQSVDGASLPFKPVGHGGSLTPPGVYGSQTPHSDKALASFGSPVATMSERSNREPGPHLPATGVPSTHTLSAEEQLKAVDPRVLELVSSEVLQQLPLLDWSALTGLDAAKATLKEHILWPALQPDLFSSRHTHPHSPPGPTHTVLLFGPRGAGRSLLASCVASQLGAVFFHLRCSVLLSDWLAESERILRATFLLAHARQPAVVLLSEVELVLAAQPREEAPALASRRELLAWLERLRQRAEDGAAARVLLLCSTRRPQQLEETLARRYMTCRVAVPLPDSAGRLQVLGQSLARRGRRLDEADAGLLAQRTEGLSAQQLRRLCQEALRAAAEAGGAEPSALLPGQPRPLRYQDFHGALCETQPGPGQREQDRMAEWDRLLRCSP